MPKPRFNVCTTDGAVNASKFQDAMSEALPFEKRSDWLKSRGWIDLGMSTDTRRHLFKHEDVWHGSAMNQTKAVLIECWRIMESKGFIVRY